MDANSTDKSQSLYPGLESLSLEELQALIQEDFYASEGSDTDYITAILEVMEKREAEDPNHMPIDVDAAWKTFENNYMGKKSDYIDAFPHDDTLPTIPETPIRGKTRKLPRMLAAAAVLVLLVGALTAQAFGYNVFQIVAQWTSDVFTFGGTRVVSETPPLEIEIPPYRQFESIQEVLDVIDVMQLIAPTWYPNGFVQTELIVTQFPDHIKIIEILEYADRLVSVSIKVAVDSVNDIFGFHEINEDSVMAYQSGGITHYIMSNYERMAAVWLNENLEGSIHGDITEAELKGIIDSIYGG